MIIILGEKVRQSDAKNHSKQRNEQVKTNVDRFQKSLAKRDLQVFATEVGELRQALREASPDEVKSRNKAKSEPKASEKETLYIFGHGNPNYIGELTPEELASAVAAYINQGHIDKIELCACNTGQEYDPPKKKESKKENKEEVDKSSYLQKFCLALSKLVMIDFPIRVKAPKGMLVFYNDGEQDVIRDDEPFAHNREMMEAIVSINLDDKEKAKNILYKNDKLYLNERSKFALHGVIANQLFMPKNVEFAPEIKINKEDNAVFYNPKNQYLLFYAKENSGAIQVAAETFDYMTKIFALNEQADELSEEDADREERFKKYAVGFKNR
jgi:hypothetical protein